MSNYYGTSTSNTSYGTSTSTYIPISTVSTSNYTTTNRIVTRLNNSIKLANGTNIKKLDDDNCKLELPDGTIIDIDELGNFHVNDKNSKVIYKSNSIREFNKYINASDLLEEFILFLGSEFDVRQNQIMNVPIQIFIEWLIVQAAMKDGDNYSDDMKKLDAGVIYEKNWYRRCRNCGRFIKSKLFDAGMNFCNTLCVENYQLKLGV
jgi:hypothetical protein